MKYVLRTSLIVILLLIFTFQVYADDNVNIYSPTYFDHQDRTLETISYLIDEQLAFNVCSNEIENVKASYTCKDEKYEIELFPHSHNDKSCNLGYLQLSDIGCENFSLEISYQENNRERNIKRSFSLEKETKTLENVLNEDKQNLDALDLSYYLALYSKSVSKQSQERNDAYELLRNLRDNSNKCWPENNCDISETAKILYNTQLAGFDEDTRILSDGENYLENNILSNSQIDYQSSNNIDVFDVFFELNHEFSGNEEIICDILEDETVRDDIKIDNSSNLEQRQDTLTVDNEFGLDCDERIDQKTIIFAERITDSTHRTNDDYLDGSVSTFNKNRYDDFELRIKLEHEFSTNEEISCDLTIDDQETNYIFDEDSSNQDMTIRENIENEFEFSCDERLDNLNYHIFAGEIFDEIVSNQRTTTVNANELQTQRFPVSINFEYDFSSSKLTCEFTSDVGRTRTHSFEQGDELVIDDKFIRSEAFFECDNTLDKVETSIKDKFGRSFELEEEEEISSLNIEIPEDFSRYECIGENGKCSETATLLAFAIYDDFESTPRLDAYKQSLKQKNSVSLIETNTPFKSTGMFLLSEDDEELKEGLQFRQNNEGSWGSGNKDEQLKETVWAILGLKEHNNDLEHIRDAQEWIYKNEPSSGWSSMEYNGLAFLAIEDRIKPYITISSLKPISDETQFTITNPTIFSLENLRIEFSNEIDESLNYIEDIGTLEQGQSTNISLTPQGNSGFGKMKIYGRSNNEEIELLNTPLLIEKGIPFEITKNIITFTQGESRVTIPLSHEKDEFSYSCEITTGFAQEIQEVEINEQSPNVDLYNPNEETGEFDIDFICDSSEGTQTLSDTITLQSTPKVFETQPESLVIDGTQDFSISIKNLLQEQTNVKAEVSSQIQAFIIQPQDDLLLASEEERNKYFEVRGESIDLLQQDQRGEITLTANNYSKTILVTISSDEIDEGSTLMNWILTIFLIFVVAFIVLVIIRYIQLRREDDSQEEEDVDDEIIFDE